LTAADAVMMSWLSMWVLMFGVKSDQNAVVFCCVSGVVGVVHELLLDVGDDFFDGGHFGC
jgi:hypothetical protein